MDEQRRTQDANAIIRGLGCPTGISTERLIASVFDRARQAGMFECEVILGYTFDRAESPAAARENRLAAAMNALCRFAAARVKSWETLERLQQQLRGAVDLAHSLRLIDVDIDSVSSPQPDDFVPGTIVEKDGERRALNVDMLKYFLELNEEDSHEFGLPLS